METADRFILEQVDEKIRQAASKDSVDRPFITLTYAASLDGSIASVSGQPLALSNIHSQTMTHGLRARHDAILIGINTLVADNPRLTVRLAPGNSPRSIIVDSHLRFPLNAKLLERRDACPIVATTQDASPDREKQLEAAGVKVLRVPAESDGSVSLPSLGTELARLGIRSLMVEGGARIITSFLRNKLANQFILTICPVIIGGLHAVNLAAGGEPSTLPALENISFTLLGNDIVLMADLKR